MKILIACEESQIVTKAFRERGHEAWSSDIVAPSGGHPEWHFYGDVLRLIAEDNIRYRKYRSKKHCWDMIIAFPPCTHLAVSGAAWFKEKQKYGIQQQAIDFFMKIANAKCPKIAIENPVGIMSTYWRKPDQYIQPYQFGHLEQKKTGLWLKGLPKLVETNNVYDEMMKLPRNKRERLHYLPPSEERSKLRSKTFEGIAQAMAEQWG